MCVETLKAIKGTCGGGNKGGLKQKLHLAYADAVASTPAPDTNLNRISEDLVMRAVDGAATPPVTAGLFYEIEVSRFDNSYAPEQVGDVENVSFLHKATARVNKMTAEKNFVFQGLLGRPVRAVVKDGNGTPWMLGDDENPCYVRIKPESADKNGYVLEFEYESANLLYEYTGAIPVA